jgi:hypothetical protein
MFGRLYRQLEEDLARIPTGVALLRALEAADAMHLGGYDRVEVMKARMRLISALQARFYRDLLEISEAEIEAVGNGEGWEFCGDEISAALAWSRRAADRHLDFAFALGDLPQVWEAFAEGRIDLAKTRVIVQGLEGADPEVAADIAETVLADAAHQTPGQIGARIRRLLMSLNPQAAKERYEKSTGNRRVEISANPSGTANLYALDLPAQRANRIIDRIHQLAEQAKVGNDQRNPDQVRADVLMDLLEGNQHLYDGEGGKVAAVDLRIDVTTLAGLDDKPGEIPGFGPIIADLARQLAAQQQNAPWHTTITDSETGEVIAAGLTRRRPTAALKRWVQATRPTCVFPGCRITARKADLDHTTDWAKGGKTGRHNLAPLCRHHHRTKHNGRWKLHHHQNTYTWTSPLGHTYTVQPQGP